MRRERISMKTTLMIIMSHAPGTRSLTISTTEEELLGSHHLVIMSLLSMNATLTTTAQSSSRTKKGIDPELAKATLISLPRSACVR
jgi:hypothetical protein